MAPPAPVRFAGDESAHAREPEVEAADAGVDVVFSYLSGYKLTANVEVLSLQGGAVTGIGNTLNNILIGTDGGNALNGEAGDDRLIGGGGSDSFWFLGSDAGHDRIADFDPLMLAANDFGFH